MIHQRYSLYHAGQNQISSYMPNNNKVGRENILFAKHFTMETHEAYKEVSINLQTHCPSKDNK